MPTSDDASAGDEQDPVAPATSEIASDLLGVMSALRRTLRRESTRPPELAWLTGAQIELLRLLRRSPGIPVADAADELAVAPNTISTLVRQLSDAGIVLRRAGPNDRRVGLLELAPGIDEKVGAWRDRRDVLVDGALAALPAAELAAIAAAVPVLERLVASIEAFARASRRPRRRRRRPTGSPTMNGTAVGTGSAPGNGTMPLFFASSALYPVSVMPGWLKVLSKVNPLTYEVDALRGLLISSSAHLGLDFGVLCGTVVLGIAVSASLVNRLAR